MDKWYYIEILSKMSNRSGDKLLGLMNSYNKNNLNDITYEEAKEYYEELMEENL